MSHSLWWLAVDALAVFRLTHLVARDKITEPFRERLSAPWAGITPERDYAGVRWWLFTLITCTWCMSIWIGAAAVILTRFVPGAWQYPAMALALSGVAGLLER